MEEDECGKVAVGGLVFDEECVDLHLILCRYPTLFIGHGKLTWLLYILLVTSPRVAWLIEKVVGDGQRQSYHTQQ
jgi:hypothetical protein